MPGRVYLTSGLEELGLATGADITAIGSEPPRRNIAPGTEVIALTQQGLKRMRWGIVPVGRVNARGRPVMETIINARSETVFDKSAFKGVRRAVLPVNGWYEWTGEKRRKTAWDISPCDGGFLWFAAIADTWVAPNGARLDQIATVTCEPNSDVAPIHHRMAVILEQQDIQKWMTGSESDACELMRSWPDGRLRIQKANAEDLT